MRFLNSSALGALLVAGALLDACPRRRAPPTFPEAGPSPDDGGDAGPDGGEDAGDDDAGPDGGTADAGPATFLGIVATPPLARDGTAVRIQVTAGAPLALDGGLALSVGGNAAALVDTSENPAIVFGYTARRGVDLAGDQPLSISGRRAEGSQGSGEFHGALAIDFDPVPDAGLKISVLTQHGDAQRTGANPGERQLSAADVNAQEFGKLFSRAVDGMTLSQPLLVSDLMIGGAAIDALVVATEHDSVYLFDAVDPAAAAPLWQVSLGSPVPSGEVSASCLDLVPEIGITGTPAIDSVSGALYVVAKSKDAGGYHFRLHALDLATGAERSGSPAELSASSRRLDGTTVRFDPLLNNHRAALLLSNGVVYAAFASHCDVGPYHGWVLGYDAATLQQVSAWNTTPEGSEGGVWQGGNGLAADEAGALYAAVGNGSFDAGTDFGNSVVKLAAPGLRVTDSFTPRNYAYLNALDLDLGSTGPVLLPGTNALVVGSKAGALYLLSRDALGGFSPTGDGALQELQAAKGQILGSPVVWPALSLLFVWSANDVARAFSFSSGLLQPLSQGHPSLGAGQGAQLALSADGASSGILWAVHATGGGSPPPAILRAFDASDLTREIWNSRQNAARDELGSFAKFNPPTVANGRVYVGTSSGRVVAYGILPR